MADGTPSQGAFLQIQTAAGPPAVLAEIEAVNNFTAFDGQANEIDMTHLRSTAKERIMGLQDFGSFSIDANYLPDESAPGQAALRDAKATRQRQKFKFNIPADVEGGNVSTAEFFGFVQSASMTGGVDSKIDTTFNILVDGDVTFA